MRSFVLLQIISFILTLTVSDKVRRKERQITDKAMIEKFLDEQHIIKIGYYDKKMMKYILFLLIMDIL